MKLTRAPDWQRLLVAKLRTKKAMVTPRLKLTQGRSTENRLGKSTPGRRDGELGSCPSSPPPHSPATCTLTYGGEEPPEDKEREDVSGEEEVRQQAPQDDADKGHAKQQGGQEATLRTRGESVQVHAHPRRAGSSPGCRPHPAALSMPITVITHPAPLQ